MFNQVGVRHLPVFNERQRLCGIITRKDMAPSLIEAKLLETKEKTQQAARKLQLMHSAASAMKTNSLSRQAIHQELNPLNVNLDSRRRPSIGAFSASSVSSQGSEEGKSSPICRRSSRGRLRVPTVAHAQSLKTRMDGNVELEEAVEDYERSNSVPIIRRGEVPLTVSPDRPTAAAAAAAGGIKGQEQQGQPMQQSRSFVMRRSRRGSDASTDGSSGPTPGRRRSLTSAVDGRLEQRRNSLVRLRVPPHGFTPRQSHVATFHGTSLLPRSQPAAALPPVVGAPTHLQLSLTPAAPPPNASARSRVDRTTFRFARGPSPARRLATRRPAAPRYRAPPVRHAVQCGSPLSVPRNRSPKEARRAGAARRFASAKVKLRRWAAGAPEQERRV